MVRKRRRNLHKEIIDPAALHYTSEGAVVQSYHSPRAMPKAMIGHPDVMMLWSGITWFIELKPGYSKLTDGQCEWFWKFYPQFCYTVRYVIATNYDDLLWRVQQDGTRQFDISVPEWYHKKLNAWKEAQDAE